MAPLYAILVRLLAYYVAVLNGTEVDRLRNLAKSVTVEQVRIAKASGLIGDSGGGLI